MRTFGSPFSLCLFDPADASSPAFDEALSIFRENTSPLLATRCNQIRAKAVAPITDSGTFFFACLMRSKSVIGFAMFGHYPGSRLLVFDHLVIDRQRRGENAFYAFAQLLKDAVDKMRLEFDYVVVEIEKHGVIGAHGAGGPALAHLLGHVGFDAVHTDYRIADMDPGHAPTGHAGVLMLRSAVKVHRLPRADLGVIYGGVLFDHYLPWCATFLGNRTPAYRRELEALHAAFMAGLPDEVPVNGAEEDGLLPTDAEVRELPGQAGVRSVSGYVAMIAAATVMALTLKTTPSETAMLLVVILAAYAGNELVRGGKADAVFEGAGTRRSPSPPALPRQGAAKTAGRAPLIGARGARRP